jgi:hypothetical protein
MKISKPESHYWQMEGMLPDHLDSGNSIEFSGQVYGQVQFLVKTALKCCDAVHLDGQPRRQAADFPQ